MDVSELLPRDSGLVVRDLIEGPGYVRIEAETAGCSADCPRCDVRSDRVHGRYVRAVADLPWQGRQVRIRIHVRRFRCDNPRCPQRTFAERVPAVADHAQSTRRLAEAQLRSASPSAANRARRLSRRLAMPTSPDTLLRRVRAAGSDPRPTPRVLGVDDFAFRRASTFGTILVDLERRCAVDLLPDREAATLARWLREHPGVEVVSRDRASAYARAAHEAAPDAVQVADRWHLLANLRDVLERFLHRRSVVVRGLLRDPTPEDAPCRRRRPKSRCRKPARWHRSSGSLGSSAVRRLHADGMSLRGIARALDLNYQTVERYVRSDTCPDWQPGRRRPSLLDQHEGFIRERVAAGCRNSSQIHRELQGRGCRCGKTIVKGYVRRLTAEDARPQPPQHADVCRERPAFVSFRRLAVAVIRRADERSTEEREWLARLKDGGGEIREAFKLAEGFASLMRSRCPAALSPWLGRAERGAVAELRSFASRLRRDEAAVRAGIELEWNNGPTEGQVNRLKLVKRSMYGRAGFDLLRARVLNAG